MMRDLALTIMLAVSAAASAQSIVTVAGGGSDDARPALYVAIERPSRIAIDAAGNVYVSEGQRVRRLSMTTGIMTTMAGIVSPGILGDGGPATAAGLFNPEGIAFDRSGNLYIADRSNDRVRKVAPSGIITKLAGKLGPIRGFAGDGGPATEAELAGPRGVAADDAGNVFIADTDNNRIRRVNAAGIIDTIAGNGEAAFAGDGGPATLASFNTPTDVAVDRDGNIYVADSGNRRIRRVSPGGVISTIAGNGGPGPDGYGAFSGDGGPATAASLRVPTAVAVDSKDDLYISDSWNQRIRRVDAATGTIDTVAGSGELGFGGDDGPASGAKLSFPEGIAIDASGIVYIADTDNNRVRRVAARMSTVAGNGAVRFTGDGGPATAAAVDIPTKVAADRAGNLYIADSDNVRIRKRSVETGFITTVAGTVAGPDSGDGGPATAAIVEVNDVALDGSGNLYIASFGGPIRKVAHDTGVITTLPLLAQAIAVGPADDLYAARGGRIERMDLRTQSVTGFAGGTNTEGFSGDGGPAIAAQFSDVEGLAVDAGGNVYVADSGNNRIRLIVAGTNVVSTIAGNGTETFNGTDDGGPATAAGLRGPSGVAIDKAGNLYIADTAHSRIRRVSAAGTITTVCGTGITAFRGDGARATDALLNNPGGVAFDGDGNLYIADSFNNRIREIPACISIGAPSLTQPADGSSSERPSPKLSWTPVKGAQHYDVYVDVATPPQTIVTADLTAPTCSPSLEPSTQYYWRVVAKGDPFCDPSSSAASAVFTFTTAGSCLPPGVFETRGAQ